MEGLTFEIEHLLFEGYAAGSGKAPHSAVAADDAVAGDYQRQWILGKGPADRPGGSGLA